MKKLIIILVLILSFQACKKDKLIGDKEILIGKWEWIYTEHDYGWCDGDSFIETIVPEDNNYSILFSKKGTIKFFKGENITSKKRIVFQSFKPEGIYEFWFFIKLNNNENDILRGGFINDTLVLANFPLDPIIGCESYTSYFIKQ